MNDQYTFHEVANIFPMMGEEELQDLAVDIKENGQQEPILVTGKQIIDGRNRYKACQLAGVEPQFKEYEGDHGDALVHLSMSLNLQRRHLSKSQKAIVAFKLHPMLEKFAKERQRRAGQEVGAENLIQNQLTEKIQEADEVSVSVHEEIGYGGDTLPAEGVSGEGGQAAAQQKKSKAKGQSANQAGAIVGVNGRYVSDVKRIAAESPELLIEIDEGRLSVAEAKKKVVEKQKRKPGYVPPSTKKVLSITVPASCRMLRSDLIKSLQESEKEYPGDIEVFSAVGGKSVCIAVIDKPIY